MTELYVVALATLFASANNAERRSWGQAIRVRDRDRELSSLELLFRREDAG